MDIFRVMDNSDVRFVLRAQHTLVPRHCEGVPEGFSTSLNGDEFVFVIFQNNIGDRASDFSFLVQPDLPTVSLRALQVALDLRNSPGLASSV